MRKMRAALVSSLAGVFGLLATGAAAASYNCDFVYDSPTSAPIHKFLNVTDHTPQSVIFEDTYWYTAEKTQLGGGTEVLAVVIRRDGADATAMIGWGDPFVAVVYNSYATPEDMYEIACALVPTH